MAKALHEFDGDITVYYDENNFNLYCKWLKGRALQGERCGESAKNLQVQGAVATEIGFVHYATQC